MELGLIPTKDLLDEIEKRFEHMVFAGMRILKQDDSETERFYSGSGIICKGLCLEIHDLIFRDEEAEDV